MRHALQVKSNMSSLCGSQKGQAVAAMLGAYAYNQYPLLMDLTDGKVHHLLQVVGSELFEWVDLTSRQAYYKQSEFLTSHPVLLVSRNLKLDDIPEELQQPIKKLRGLLCDAAGLQEQLDSVVPFLPEEDRLPVTLELMLEWSRSAPLQLPTIMRHIF